MNPDLKNGSSLEMTRANQTSQKGDKQVIEVIDTGIESTHPAFSGPMDDVPVRLSHKDVESLVGTLSHGKQGAYLNKKIPFAFDYADNDANVLPTSTKDLSRHACCRDRRCQRARPAGHRARPAGHRAQRPDHRREGRRRQGRLDP